MPPRLQPRDRKETTKERKKSASCVSFLYGLLSHKASGRFAFLVKRRTSPFDSLLLFFSSLIHTCQCVYMYVCERERKREGEPLFIAVLTCNCHRSTGPRPFVPTSCCCADSTPRDRLLVRSLSCTNEIDSNRRQLPIIQSFERRRRRRRGEKKGVRRFSFCLSVSSVSSDSAIVPDAVFAFLHRGVPLSLSLFIYVAGGAVLNADFGKLRFCVHVVFAVGGGKSCGRRE